LEKIEESKTDFWKFYDIRNVPSNPDHSLREDHPKKFARKNEDGEKDTASSNEE